MYKLYGVDSCYESGRQLNCVVLALSEEDAITEFYKDVNCRNYAMIMGVHEIKGNKCTILYQLQREILDYKESEWELKETNIGEGTWSRNAFTLVCKDAKDVVFNEELVHSTGSEIEVMICLHDNRPNWVTL